MKGVAVNHIQTRFSGLCALFLVLAAPLFGQGFTWESTTTSTIEGMKPVHSVASYASHMFRQTTGTKTTILRLDKETMTVVDNEKKEYSETTFSELEQRMKAAGGAMNSKMAEMKKKLESLPPDKRKMVEQMMGDKLSGGSKETTVDVKKSDETKTISGYPCTKYDIIMNGKDFGSVWTTEAIPEFAAMKDDFISFSKRMAELSPMYGKEIGSGMSKIKGFPVETDFASFTVTVTKFSKQAVPASDFEVPSGYKKVAMMEHRMKGMPPEHEGNE
jgi:GLPGLI family protein